MSEIAATRVAANVRAELARASISGRRLAGVLGISQPAMSRRLRGEIAFDVVELTRIAAETDVPLSRLLGDGSSDDGRGAA